MPITRLNHAVLFVRDAELSAAFYAETLGFKRLSFGPPIPGAVFMQAPGSTNDHDLGLFSVGSVAGNSGAGRSTVGLYHLAWEVETLEDLDRIAVALSNAGALGHSSDHGTTKSLYGHDPDGLEFEIAWIIPAALLTQDALDARETVMPLDLEREKARYGAKTIGGVGISSRA